MDIATFLYIGQVFTRACRQPLFHSADMPQLSRSVGSPLFFLFLLVSFFSESAVSQTFTVVEHGEDFVPDIILRVTQVNISQPCVPERPVVLVNGTYPGPPIYLDEGKTTWIRVYNDIPTSNTTMVYTRYTKERRECLLTYTTALARTRDGRFSVQ